MQKWLTQRRYIRIILAYEGSIRYRSVVFIGVDEQARWKGCTGEVQEIDLKWQLLKSCPHKIES